MAYCGGAMPNIMSQIDDWFTIGKAVTKLNVNTKPILGGRPTLEREGSEAESIDSYIPKYKRNMRNTPAQVEYARLCQMEEDRLLTSVCHQTGGQGLSEETHSELGSMYQLEVDTIHDLDENQLAELEELRTTDVYNNYNFQHTYDKALPITMYRSQIMKAIDSFQVIVIQGCTGSGKTTQVPQYIIDHSVSENKYCNVIVTQPRRIAAASVARRVCDERNWSLGSLVGYSVARDSVVSEDTRLQYVTTGVLLERLINDKHMNKYTHVILDEVHERDQDSDFALLVVRKFLRSNSRNVKVILMSATFDTALFANYFSQPVRGMLEPAPVISIEGKMHPVTIYFTDDLTKLGAELPEIKVDDPRIDPASYTIARCLILHFDLLEAQDAVVSGGGPVTEKGTVLVFLPGYYEIKTLHQMMDKDIMLRKLELLPCHSDMPCEEQRKVFKKPEPGKRKIILATNIAESSITVPDIRYVIDFCLSKCMVCDIDTNYQSLRMTWASKANAEQRKGRAGRVQSGRCYRLISEDFWNNHIPEYGIPEMQRCPLEQLVLQVKKLNIGEPKSILGLALQPPNLDDIEKTVLLLKEVRGLSSDPDSSNPYNGNLTFVGRALASLPVDIRVGKLMLYGHVFGCLHETIIIAASMSLKSFFARPYNLHLEAYKGRIKWACGSYSDSIACLQAYQDWMKKKSEGYFLSYKQEEYWCTSNMIERRRIHEVADLVLELQDRLQKLNICVPRGRRHHTQEDIDYDSMLVLKIVIAGAFYPNYFTCSNIDETEAVKEMSGNDLQRTVMVRGVPDSQGHLYQSQLKRMFACCGPVSQINFEGQKAYVVFQRSTQPTQAGTNVDQAVYLALKMKQLRIPIEIQLGNMDKPGELRQYHSAKGLHSNRYVVGGDRQQEVTYATPPTSEFMNVYITHVVEVGHFYGHIATDDVMSGLVRNHSQINEWMNEERPKPISKVEKSMICLAPYSDEDGLSYYRAKVLDYDAKTVKLFYLDFGDECIFNRDHLFEIRPDFLTFPFQALEFQMCKLRIVQHYSSNSVQQTRILNDFSHRVLNRKFVASIYSVVHGVVRVELHESTPSACINLNEYFINSGIAENAQESRLSEMNHQQRIKQHIEQTPQPLENESSLSVNPNQLPAPQFSAHSRKHLHGPDSPLMMTFHGITNIGRLRSMKVERDSCNSISLDDEPSDKHHRMLVAGSISVNMSGNIILARETTMMPRILGLPALCALLFAPVAELRTSKDKTRLSGCLCGLGAMDNSPYPILPDNDIEMTFDAKIDKEDIPNVNGVRMTINILLGSNESQAEWGPIATMQLQSKARTQLLRLVQKSREPVPVEVFPRQYQWNQTPDYLKEEPSVLDEHADSSTLLPLVCGVILQEPEEDTTNVSQIEELREYTRHLRLKASRSILPEELECRICDLVCQNRSQLLIHIGTSGHIQQEKRFFSEDK